MIYQLAKNLTPFGPGWVKARDSESGTRCFCAHDPMLEQWIYSIDDGPKRRVPSEIVQTIRELDPLDKEWQLEQMAMHLLRLKLDEREILRRTVPIPVAPHY